MSYFLSRTLVPTMVHHMLRAGGGDLRAAARKGNRRSSKGFIWRVHHAFNSGLRSMRERYTRRLWAGLCIIARDRDCVRGVCSWRRCVLCPGRRARFLPLRGFRADAAACRRPAGHAHRGDGAAFSRSMEADDPPNDSARTNWQTLLDNIGLPNGGINLAFGDTATDRHVRWRNSDLAEAGQAIDIAERYERALRDDLHATVSRRNVLFPGGQHHEPDFEFRYFPRRSTCRWWAAIRQRKITRLRRQIWSRVCRDSRARWTCTSGRKWTAPTDRCQRGSQQGGSGRTDAARRRQQHADFAQLERAGGAQPVAESAERRELPGRRADAAVPHGFDRRAAAHADHAPRPAAPRSCCRTWRPSNAARSRRADRITTTCSRSSTCTPTWTGATWAAWPTDIEKVLDEYDANCRGARRSIARPGGDDAGVVQPARLRDGVCRPAGLPADGGQFPVLAGSVHHSDGAAGRAGGHSLDALRHAEPRSTCPR